LDFKIEISGGSNLQGNSKNTGGLEKTRETFALNM
jgi:hypothetical protein